MTTDSLYEIVSPSDPYTIRGEVEPVCLAVVLIGHGKLGLHDARGSNVDQAFFDPFSRTSEKLDAHWREHFGRPWEAAMEALKPDVAAVLESVVIGSVARRADYESAMAAIDDDGKQREFAAAWRERHRSSMSDIGGYAAKLAALVRKAIGENQ